MQHIMPEPPACKTTRRLLTKQKELKLELVEAIRDLLAAKPKLADQCRKRKNGFANAEYIVMLDSDYVSSSEAVDIVPGRPSRLKRC